MPDLTKLGARAIMFALAALFILAVIIGGYNAITAKPKAEARLGKNQAESATASGRDAANTVGTAGARDAGIDATTRENERNIRNAQGADAPVAAPVRDAGLVSLCRRASHLHDPKCLLLAHPRDVANPH